MDNLRVAANHVVLKIILGVIAVSFVLTGVGNYLIGGDGDYVAKVNGQQISRAQLEQANLSEKAQLSGVIKSSVGFLIVSLDYVAPVLVSPLSAVHDEVAAKVKQEKAIDAYYALQQNSERCGQLMITRRWHRSKPPSASRRKRPTGSAGMTCPRR